MYSRETGGRLKSSSRNSHRTLAAEQLEQGCVLVHFICTEKSVSSRPLGEGRIEEGPSARGLTFRF